MSLKLIPVILPNIKSEDEIKFYLNQLDLDGVILTGGNDLAWTKSDKAAIERDQFEHHVISWMVEKNKPILGVCRGMQKLNLYFGGTLVKVAGHVCKSHKIKTLSGHDYKVNSYHDWGVVERTLASDLISLAHTDDGVVEYCRHKELPITGMMWHPERQNIDHDFGLSIINETFL